MDMPVLALDQLLLDFWGIDVRTASMDQLDDLYPREERLFADRQLLTSAELRQQIRELPENTPAIITDRLFLSWMAIHTAADAYLLGPFRMFEQSTAWMNQALQALFPDQDRLSDFQKYRRRFPRLEHEQLPAVLRVMNHALHIAGDAPLLWINLFHPGANRRLPEGEREKYIDEAYQVEAKYLAAVRHGRTEEAVTALRAIQRRFRREDYREDPLKGALYGHAIICTMARIAAWQANVPPRVLDELFATNMEIALQTADRKALLNLPYSMTANVCEQVQRVRTMSYSPLIRKAVCYTLNHQSEIIREADLAALMGVTREYFSARFARETGEGFSGWLLRLRLERASELLRLNALPVSEIAFSCGFPDQNYFSRCFRRAYGMSPSAWRGAGRLGKAPPE